VPRPTLGEAPEVGEPDSQRLGGDLWQLSRLAVGEGLGHEVALGPAASAQGGGEGRVQRAADAGFAAVVHEVKALSLRAGA
jgi:hypothetical protein